MFCLHNTSKNTPAASAVSLILFSLTPCAKFWKFLTLLAAPVCVLIGSVEPSCCSHAYDHVEPLIKESNAVISVVVEAPLFQIWLLDKFRTRSESEKKKFHPHKRPTGPRNHK